MTEASLPPVETAPPPWREVFQGARGRLTAGLLILEALVAVEIMVVATILPAVQASSRVCSSTGGTTRRSRWRRSARSRSRGS